MSDILNTIPRPSKHFLQTIKEVGVHDHICLLYRDSEEGLVSAASFIEAGIKSNDQCIYVNDENSPEEVIEALESLGVDAQNAVQSGQLVFDTKNESYLGNGTFEPDVTIKRFADASKEACSQGFRSVRGCAEMTWQLNRGWELESLLDYESRLNHELFPGHQVVGMCQFNLTHFRPVVIREIILTHPLVLIGGLICENFYYQAPGYYGVDVSDNWAKYDVERMVNDLYEFAKVRYSTV